MSSALITKAQQCATDLLDRYPEALEDLSTAHMLLKCAYLQGSMDGSDEAVTILRSQLEIATVA